MKLNHATLIAALLAATGAASAADQVVIGLITKTETNPFFVKMKEGVTLRPRPRAPSCSAAQARPTATTPAR